MGSLTLARDYQIAAELLDRTMTKIDTMGPDQLSVDGPTQGVFEPPNDRFTWEAVIEPQFEGSLYEVTVRISWPAGGGKRRDIQAQTLLNAPWDLSKTTLDWEDF